MDQPEAREPRGDLAEPRGHRCIRRVAHRYRHYPATSVEQQRYPAPDVDTQLRHGAGHLEAHSGSGRDLPAVQIGEALDLAFPESREVAVNAFYRLSPFLFVPGLCRPVG